MEDGIKSRGSLEEHEVGLGADVLGQFGCPGIANLVAAEADMFVVQAAGSRQQAQVCSQQSVFWWCWPVTLTGNYTRARCFKFEKVGRCV